MVRSRKTRLDRLNASMMKFREQAEGGIDNDDPWLLNPFFLVLAIVWDFLGIIWS